MTGMGNTVSTMLERPEYMGHTVNFRSSKKSYRDKRVKNAPEDWLVFGEYPRGHC